MKQINSSGVRNAAGPSARSDYFSVVHTSVITKHNSGATNRSTSTVNNKSVSATRQSNQETSSYTKMCRELDTQIEIPSPGEEENSEKLSKLTQMVAHYRSTAKRLEV